MDSSDHVEVVKALLRATGERDWTTYASLLTEAAQFRRGGVPSNLGGTLSGSGAIVNSMRANLGNTTFELQQVFGGDDHVCAIQKIESRSFPGNQFLRGASRPFTTTDCTVFRFEGDLIAEITVYTNWLDVYIQAGLVDLDVLARRGQA